MAEADGERYTKVKNDDYGALRESWVTVKEWKDYEYLYFIEEPIEWQVLEVKGDKAFVVSRYGLDQHQYHYEKFIDDDIFRPVEVTWEMSDVRKWMQ